MAALLCATDAGVRPPPGANRRFPLSCEETMSSDASLLITLLREVLPILVAELRNLRSEELRDLEDDAAVTLALDRMAERADGLRRDQP
jgi:hypothetical protein